jgi:hypothetical protein
MHSWCYALLVGVLVLGSSVADGPVPPPVPNAPLVGPLRAEPPQYSWPAARRTMLRLREIRENAAPRSLALYERHVDQKIDLCVRIAMGMSLFR